MADLPRKTSVGDDDLAYIDLLYAAYYITDPVLVIINDVLRSGYWSKTWLNSIVKPLFKGREDEWDAGHYRLDTLKGCISRIIERVLTN